MTDREGDDTEMEGGDKDDMMESSEVSSEVPRGRSVSLGVRISLELADEIVVAWVSLAVLVMAILIVLFVLYL